MIKRIAMWSGPRNISTATMRAFENRDDTEVSDEPFYAAFLAASGAIHPMREEVIASQPNDWRDVAAACSGPAPGGSPIWYQKQMCHHMLPEFGLDWLGGCTNAFLIRPPSKCWRRTSPSGPWLRSMISGWFGRTRFSIGWRS